MDTCIICGAEFKKRIWNQKCCVNGDCMMVNQHNVRREYEKSSRGRERQKESESKEKRRQYLKKYNGGNVNE